MAKKPEPVLESEGAVGILEAPKAPKVKLVKFMSRRPNLLVIIKADSHRLVEVKGQREQERVTVAGSSVRFRDSFAEVTEEEAKILRKNPTYEIEFVEEEKVRSRVNSESAAEQTWAASFLAEVDRMRLNVGRPRLTKRVLAF